MSEKIFETDNGVAIVIPREIAQRYHLIPGVEVDIEPVEEGILLEPRDVAPWFSIEWERALEAVVERYQGAFVMMREDAPAGEDGTPASGS